MSTTTATFGHGEVATATTTAPRKSFYERLIEARMRQAQIRLRSIFARMSDAQLADVGFNADQIRAVRAKGTVPVGYWS